MDNIGEQVIKLSDQIREEQGKPPVTAAEELKMAAKILEHGVKIYNEPVSGVMGLVDDIKKNTTTST
ncbi:hypothetical protein ACFWZ2_13465 [Streptomyces sp. NPDC059002]|uniref:hypothetical protein n=1 Tax=Streptomyces sp. NPDC059002 TaxID=3346690 RepID=UPI0036BE3E59